MTLSMTFSAACNQLLVVLLSTTGLLDLEILVLVLVLGNSLAAKDFLDNGPLPLLAGKAVVTAVSRARNDGSHLAVLRNEVLAVVLLEVLLSESHNVTHPQDLQVSLQLWRQICLGHVIPIGSRIILWCLLRVSELSLHQLCLNPRGEKCSLRVTMNIRKSLCCRPQSHDGTLPCVIQIWDILSSENKEFG